MTRIAINHTVTPKPPETVPAPKPRAEVIRVPALNRMLSDAQTIVGLELELYRRKKQTNPDKPLTEAETRIVNQNVRSVAAFVEIERGLREGDDAYTRLTDEQLVKLVGEALKAIGAPK